MTRLKTSHPCPCRVSLACGALLFALLVPVAASEGEGPCPRVLVLTSGEIIRFSGSVKMQGRLMVFHLTNGTLVSLKAEQIDQDRTREAAKRILRAEAETGKALKKGKGQRPGQAISSDSLLKARISLDLKDADIKDLLRFLAEQAGMNLVLASEVQGTVTLRLHDVALADALYVILKTMNLGMDRRSGVAWIAPHHKIIEGLRNR